MSKKVNLYSFVEMGMYYESISNPVLIIVENDMIKSFYEKLESAGYRWIASRPSARRVAIVDQWNFSRRVGRVSRRDALICPLSRRDHVGSRREGTVLKKKFSGRVLSSIYTHILRTTNQI